MNLNLTLEMGRALGRLLADVELDPSDDDHETIEDVHRRCRAAISTAVGRGMPSDEIVGLYTEAGFSLTEISNLTGIPRSTIRYRLRKAGIELRGVGGNRSELAHQEYIKTAFMYKRLGLTTTEIAELLDLSHDAICNRLSTHGVKMRSRGESARLRFARRPKATPPKVPASPREDAASRE